MLRTDSFKPYWKEKFIDGLPLLFAHKVKDELIDLVTGSIEYEILMVICFQLLKNLALKCVLIKKMLRKLSMKRIISVNNLVKPIGSCLFSPSFSFGKRKI